MLRNLNIFHFYPIFLFSYFSQNPPQIFDFSSLKSLLSLTSLNHRPECYHTNKKTKSLSKQDERCVSLGDSEQRLSLIRFQLTSLHNQSQAVPQKLTDSKT